jgi:hypothetical protein
MLIFKKAFFVSILLILQTSIKSEEKDNEIFLQRYRREAVKTELSSPTSSPVSTKKYNKKNENWKKTKKDQSTDLISDVEGLFLCVNFAILDPNKIFNGYWNCEKIKEFTISEQNTFDCREKNILVEVNAIIPTPGNTPPTTVKKLNVFLRPDGDGIVSREVDNEQSYSDDCIHFRQYN